MESDHLKSHRRIVLQDTNFGVRRSIYNLAALMQYKKIKILT